MVKWRQKIQILLLLFAVSLIFPQEKEYDVKAYFLREFTHFIKWTADSLADKPDKSFIIGIYGNDPFEGRLSQIYSDTDIQGKKVELRRIYELFEITDCDLLFISRTSKNELPDILAVTANRPILTVGDTPGFAEQGVLINFYMDSNKTRFEINYNAIQMTGLSFDYKLLNLARIIRMENR